MTKFVIAALIALTLSSSTFAAAQPSTNPLALSLAPSKWTTLSTTQPFPLATAPDGSLSFAFPHDADSMNYLYYAARFPKLRQPTGVTVTIAAQTSGNPTFNYMFEPGNTCISPAKVRPFIMARNDWSGEFARWWSNPTAYTLANGTMTFTLPFDPALWSSVYGKFGTYDAAAAAGFQDAITHLSSVGVTFGGGCFFGHGVSVSGGDATFYLSSYVVQQ